RPRRWWRAPTPRYTRPRTPGATAWSRPPDLFPRGRQLGALHAEVAGLVELEAHRVDDRAAEHDDRQRVEPNEDDHDEDRGGAEPRDRADARQVEREGVVDDA